MKKNKRLLYTLESIPEEYIEEAMSEQARKMKPQWKYIITAAACFVLITAVPVFMFKNTLKQNGSNGNGNDTVSEVSETASVSSTDVTTSKTEPAITSKTVTPCAFPGTGHEKPADYTPDRKYCGAGNFSLEDGYFVVSFLKDKEFEEKINTDIREATDSMKPYFDEKYFENASVAADANPWEDIYKTNGIIALPACKNGFLSIMLTYVYNINDKDGIPSIRSYEHAVTLNYDLFEQKKIEQFSDLFYKDEDVLSLINESITQNIDNDPYLSPLQKKKFDGFTSLPELFTLNSIIFNTDNPYFSAAPEFFYSDERIYDHMIIGKYRDMKDITDENNYNECYDGDYMEWIYKSNHVTENNFTTYYVEVAGSRFHTQEEINEYNDLYNKIQHIAVEYYINNFDPEDLPNTFCESDTGYTISLGNCNIRKNEFLNNVYTVYDMDFHHFYIDIKKDKVLSLSDILKKDLKPDDWDGTMKPEDWDGVSNNKVYENVDINLYKDQTAWSLLELYPDGNSYYFSISFFVDGTRMYGKIKTDALDPDYINKDNKTATDKYF